MSSDSKSQTLFVATYVEVVRSRAPEAVTLLAAERDTSLKDSGVGRFDVLQRLDRPNQFVVLSTWVDEPAFERHGAADHVKELVEQISPWLSAPFDSRRHVGLSIGVIRAAGGPASVSVATHVDVVPQYKEDGMSALETLATQSRKHRGNLRFDVWQQPNRPNHFTVVEAWTTRAALEAHAAAMETKGFRQKLAVMTGALYDERLFHRLD